MAAFLWSCKESVYKIMLRKGYQDAFVPKLFESNSVLCRQNKINTGIITQTLFNNNIFYCKSTATDMYVHTIASSIKTPLYQIQHSVQSAPGSSQDDISKLTYHNLLKSVSKQYKLSLNRLSIKKDSNGKPFLYFDDTIFNIPFSVSHDDIFISFAFIKNHIEHANVH